MKFKTYLTEATKEMEAFQAWADEMNVNFFRSKKSKSPFYKVSKGVVTASHPDRMHFNINVYGKAEPNMMAQYSTEMLKWTPPPVKSWVGWDEVAITGLEIDDWTGMPNIRRIEIGQNLHNRMIINSFKNIEKLDQINVLLFLITADTKINCGLLRLLKIPHIMLLTVKTDGDVDEKLVKALDIVSKAVANRSDVIDCQNALVDAELEEYAKL